ncbi:MAG: hypothetical protein K1X67_23930 [Fimbriimonadaceae bacterium]|nr:hypothetical protein [Fimbriimonadaceae bacterium]
MNRRIIYRFAFIGIAFVFLVLFGTHVVMTRFFEQPQKPGEYGDMFGVADAIFSGLALTAAFITLWLQGDEIRRTLKDHREAIELQALASLNDAVRAAVSEGDTSSYEFHGKTYTAAELQQVLLKRLIDDYGVIADARTVRKLAAKQE